MTPPAGGRRFTDESSSAGEFEFQRSIPYPCEAHSKWLQKLDDRMWTILVAVCGGAVASFLTLLLLLMKKGG